MSKVDLKTLVRDIARELGFTGVGVAQSVRPWSADRFERWLDEGHHGGMDYLQRRRKERVDLDQLVPGARSVVSLAIGYGVTPEAPLAPGSGRVARYARGRDYHNVVGKLVRKLSRALRREAPQARVYQSVDTGPVLERAWASAAGVASPGKSGNSLRSEEGSYLFLAQLVTDLELSPDVPATDLCGACVACMDACPTAAILEPGWVDARRCIAYLTIEHRGVIDSSLRSSLGEWLFGCDDCQTVCPITPTERAPDHLGLQAIPGREALDARMLLGLSDDGYHRQFLGSPLRRAGAPGMRRNAALRLGNEGDPAAATVLGKALGEDPEPVVRQSAAWALGKIGTSAARRQLESALTREPEAGVCAEINDALEVS